MKKGILFVLLSSFFYLLVNVSLRTFPSHIPLSEILFLQNLAAFLGILPFALKDRTLFRTPHWKMHLIRGGAGLASYILLFFALKNSHLVDATTLHFTSPFFVPILCFYWLKEKFPQGIWYSIALGFIGTFIILDPTWDIFDKGSLYALFAALFSAIAVSAVRGLNLKGEPFQKILFLFFAFCAVATFPFAMAQWVPPAPEDWLRLGLLGLLLIGNHFFLTRAFFYAPASTLVPLSYTTLVYAALFSWLVLKEPIDARSLLGSGLILLGGASTYFLSKRPSLENI